MPDQFSHPIAATIAMGNPRQTCPCTWFGDLVRDGLEARHVMRRKHFSKRLKILLDERHWTHERFAELIGLSVSMISHYKTARSIPPTEQLEDIADLFHVSIDWLLGRTDIREIAKSVPPPEQADPPTDDSPQH
jgi:hypothetical protein